MTCRLKKYAKPHEIMLVDCGVLDSHDMMIEREKRRNVLKGHNECCLNGSDDWH